MYTPVTSFSMASRFRVSNSGSAGSFGDSTATAVSAPRSNSDIWPSTACLRRLDSASMARSYTESFWLRAPGRLSSAPARIRFSTAFLLTASSEIRRTKSNTSVNGAICACFTMA